MINIPVPSEQVESPISLRGFPILGLATASLSFKMLWSIALKKCKLLSFSRSAAGLAAALERASSSCKRSVTKASELFLRTSSPSIFEGESVDLPSFERSHRPRALLNERLLCGLDANDGVGFESDEGVTVGAYPAEKRSTFTKSILEIRDMLDYPLTRCPR